MSNLFCPICEDYTIEFEVDTTEKKGYWICCGCGFTHDCGELYNTILKRLCKKAKRRVKRIKELEEELITCVNLNVEQLVKHNNLMKKRIEELEAENKKLKEVWNG